MANFLIVCKQVLILFVLLFVGFFLGKRQIITEKGGKVCSDLAMFLATPCVIIISFQQPYSAALLQDLLLALGVSFGIHLVGIVVSHLVYRKNDATTNIYRASSVMSNASFMGIPLQQALLGEKGVIYGAAYSVVLTVVLWTYGVLVMGKKGEKISLAKVLLNPGSIGLVVGLLLFVCRITLPELIHAPVQHLAALNTPLPMLFAGYYLSKIDMKKALGIRGNYGAVAMRLVIVPIIAAAVLFVCGVRGTLLISMMVSACAPTAISMVMLADRLQADTETAINLVALSTLASVVTMPILIATIQQFA